MIAVKSPDTIDAPSAVKKIESAKNSYCIRRSLVFEKVDSCADDPTAVRTRIPCQPRHNPGSKKDFISTIIGSHT